MTLALSALLPYRATFHKGHFGFGKNG